jgi:hypothetical protein
MADAVTRVGKATAALENVRREILDDLIMASFLRFCRKRVAAIIAGTLGGRLTGKKEVYPRAMPPTVITL